LVLNAFREKAVVRLASMAAMQLTRQLQQTCFFLIKMQLSSFGLGHDLSISRELFFSLSLSLSLSLEQTHSLEIK
jgi:hypothetical protein